jgi:hypothetical protein
MGKKKLPDLQITELILVKCGEDWTRTFMGETRREKNEDWKSVVLGNVVINEGKIWCVAESEELLGKYLDDICTIKLDMGLHSSAGVTTQILGLEFFLN